MSSRSVRVGVCQNTLPPWGWVIRATLYLAFLWSVDTRIKVARGAAVSTSWCSWALALSSFGYTSRRGSDKSYGGSVFSFP
jgi:hypothetical protein